MKDVFSKKELVDLEYFIKDMGIKVGYESKNFAVTNGCATYYLYLDGFEQRTCLFKPSYFDRNPKGNWIAVDFVIGKNGNCVLGSVRNIDPSVAKNSSNYSDFYKGYVGKYWKFDVPHDFFDYMNESKKKSARKSIKESKIIKCVDLGYDSHTGKDYYDIVLDLRNENLYYIKNAGCNATAISYCCEINGLDYDGVTMGYFKIIYWNECAKGVPHIVDIDRVNKKYKKYIKDVILENKFTEKSLKEYRTVGLEQEVREKCIEILEDSHSDLFGLEYSDAILTYDNKGRAKTTSSGDVWIDYITLPLYSWSSGSFPSNKKAEKIFNSIIDTNIEMARERLWDEYEDELVELGITSKDDDKLNYNDLYDMDRGDLAEKLSEYEMDMEGTELYTNVGCDITEVDDGIELEVSMLIADEYGYALVKDYKSKSVIITEDTKDIEDVILDCIRSVTENW